MFLLIIAELIYFYQSHPIHRHQPDSKKPTSVFLSCTNDDQSSKPIVLLPTAIVRVSGATHGSHYVKALIDPGSQVNIIYEGLVEIRRPETRDTDCVIHGLAVADSRASKMTSPSQDRTRTPRGTGQHTDDSRVSRIEDTSRLQPGRPSSHHAAP